MRMHRRRRPTRGQRVRRGFGRVVESLEALELLTLLVRVVSLPFRLVLRLFDGF